MLREIIWSLGYDNEGLKTLHLIYDENMFGYPQQIGDILTYMNGHVILKNEIINGIRDTSVCFIKYENTGQIFHYNSNYNFGIFIRDFKNEISDINYEVHKVIQHFFYNKKINATYDFKINSLN